MEIYKFTQYFRSKTNEFEEKIAAYSENDPEVLSDIRMCSRASGPSQCESFEPSCFVLGKATKQCIDASSRWGGKLVSTPLTYD